MMISEQRIPAPRHGMVKLADADDGPRHGMVWFSLVFIEFLWFSLDLVGFRWFSLVFVSFPSSRCWPEPARSRRPAKSLKIPCDYKGVRLFFFRFSMVSTPAGAGQISTTDQKSWNIITIIMLFVGFLWSRRWPEPPESRRPAKLSKYLTIIMVSEPHNDQNPTQNHRGGTSNCQQTIWGGRRSTGRPYGGGRRSAGRP